MFGLVRQNLALLAPKFCGSMRLLDPLVSVLRTFSLIRQCEHQPPVSTTASGLTYLGKQWARRGRPPHHAWDCASRYRSGRRFLHKVRTVALRGNTHPRVLSLIDTSDQRLKQYGFLQRQNGRRHRVR